jgi:ribose transport system substrate-binding protein
MGEALGEMLLKESGPAPYVAVYIGNLLRYSEKEMLQGLTETVEGAGGSILLIETDKEYMKTALTRSGEADAIAVLEDALLMRAAELSVSQGLPGGRLFGIGCSPSNISYLDRGVISGMVIPNEFTMGYQSLAQLSRCLSNDIPVMKDIEIGFSCVLTEEVHDPENEKLLFPVVQ